ncbi:hypothetical protein JHU04_004266 [Brenneria sp. 4F2]|nr:hypothetical protein [Brenneria bubanii]
MLAGYHESFLKKILYLFEGVVISDVTLIADEDDEIVDNVVFFNIENDSVVGLYINGSNPFVTRSNIDDFDDFNLYALYEKLYEKKLVSFSPFKVECIRVFFHPSYNEVISIYLSSSDFLSSVFCVFLNDELRFYVNCKDDDLKVILEGNLIHFEKINFIIFQRNINEPGWNLVDEE